MTNTTNTNTFGSVGFNADYDETMERNQILADMYAEEEREAAEAASITKFIGANGSMFLN